MREYLDENKTVLAAVVCNKCKKKLLVENGILKEGCFDVNAAFGYFSKKDGQLHSFDMCEDCYDDMISQFQIPVEGEDAKELL